MIDQPTPDLSEPISLLLSKEIVNMTDDELRAYVQEMRTLRTAPQTLRAKLEKESKSLEPKSKRAVQAKLETLMSEYL
jgi:hypothetical protein